MMASITKNYESTVEEVEEEFHTPCGTPPTSRPSTPDFAKSISESGSAWRNEAVSWPSSSVSSASLASSPVFSLVSRSRSTSTGSNESNIKSINSSKISSSFSPGFTSTLRSSSRSPVSSTCQSPWIYTAPTKLRGRNPSPPAASGKTLSGDKYDRENPLRISYNGSTKHTSIPPETALSKPKSSSAFSDVVSQSSETPDLDQEDEASYHTSIFQICLESLGKTTLKQTENARPNQVFCCKDPIKHSHSKILLLKTDFITQANYGCIKTREQWTETDIQSITHVVEIDPTAILKRNIPRTYRFFAHTSSSNDYFEVNREVFEKWDDDSVDLGARSCYVCTKHNKVSRLLTHIKREKVKMQVGLKEPESAMKCAREKRRIWQQRMTYLYGANEEL